MQNEPDPISRWPSSGPLQMRSRTLGVLALLMAAGALASFVLSSTIDALTTGHQAPENALALLLAVLALVAYGLQRAGLRRYMGPVALASMVLVFVLSTLMYGSSRTSVNFLMVAVVVSAGLFMRRWVLVAVVAASAALVGALMWAEAHALLGAPPALAADFKLWSVQALVVAGISVLVSYGHRRILSVYAQEIEQVEYSLMIEDERDRGMQRFDHLFHACPAPMLVRSPRTGAILDINSAFIQHLGYLPQQVLGSGAHFLWQSAAEMHAYRASLSRYGRCDDTVTLLHADGRPLRLRALSQMTNQDGDHLIMVVMTRPEAAGAAQQPDNAHP